MKTLINKATSALSGFVLFAVACAMVGLGIAVLGLLAFFALIAVGAALLASPFVSVAEPADEDTIDAPATA